MSLPLKGGRHSAVIRVGGRSRRTTRRERRVNRLRQRVRSRGGVTVKKPRRATGPVAGQRPWLGPRFGWLRFTRWQCSLSPRELYSFCIAFLVPQQCRLLMWDQLRTSFLFYSLKQVILRLFVPRCSVTGKTSIIDEPLVLSVPRNVPSV